MCYEFFSTVSTEPCFYGYLSLKDLCACVTPLYAVTFAVIYTAYVEQVKGSNEAK